MESTSAFGAVASEIISASHVELAVESWRFDRQDRGQQRFPSSLRILRHRPDVPFVVSRSPAKSASGDMTSTAIWRSSEDRSPTNSRSAA